jgi:hypothetical protein
MSKKRSATPAVQPQPAKPSEPTDGEDRQAQSELDKAIGRWMNEGGCGKEEEARVVTGVRR